MKFLGFGLGLRAQHYSDVIRGPVRVDWFEALTENYFGLDGVGHGPPLRNLLKVREKFPIVLHGVSLSIGNGEELSKTYLQKLRDLERIVQPEWISDHICWTGIQGKNFHDLLPVQYSQQTIQEICVKLDQLQNAFGRPFVLENASTYVELKSNEMAEWEFVAEVLKKSGCKLLLDLNNIFVSSRNHGFDPYEYLNAIPAAAIAQIHLAGPEDHDTYFIDTHDTNVRPEVWELYKYSLKKFGAISTMVEWDSDIPKFPVLEDEILMAKKYYLEWREKNEAMERPIARI